MPDFENNEIQDSAFPVEFNDEHEALDMYGVWVKSGPRDISAYDEPSESFDSMNDEAVLPVFDKVPDISEFEELPDFDIDLDEFDTESDDTAVSELDMEELTADEALVEPAVSSDEEPAVSSSDEPVAELAEDAGSDELPDFDIDLDEFDTESDDTAVSELDMEELTADEAPVEPAVSSDEEPVAELAEDAGSDELPDFDINLDEFDTENDDTAVSELDMEELVAEEAPVEPAVSSSDEPVAELAEDAGSDELPDFDINLDEFDTENDDTVISKSDMEELVAEEAPVEPAVSSSEEPAVSSIDEPVEELPDFDINLDEFDTENDDTVISESDMEELASDEAPLEPAVSSIDEPVAELAEDAGSDELPDFDIDLDEFDDESEDRVSEEEVFEEELEIARDSSENAREVPDTPTTDDTPSSDEVDLSAFLNEFEASSPTPSANSDSSEFDSLDLDDFINEINESGGSSDKDKEKFFDDADPVDIDLEFDEDFIENSEKIRAVGSLISEPEFKSSEFGVEFVDETDSDADSSDFDTFEVADIDEENLPDVAPSVESDLENASEFDDLLASLDDAKPSVDRTEKDTEKETVDFNLMVTEEDGLESIVSATPESSDTDEDVAVPLFGDAANNDSGVTIDMDPGNIEEETEEIESLDVVDSDDTIAFDEDTPAVDTGNEIYFDDDIVVEDMEIVEKDNLEITEDSDYNEVQSGEDSVEEKQDVSIDFDDVGAFEESLHESGTDTGEYDVTSNDKSTELLMLIAEELSSIKKELSSLNTELSTVKKAPLPHVDTSDEPEDAESGNTGFFSDDDTDEAIALTGDELNNILITADFTEEKNEEAAKTGDISGEDTDSTSDDLTVADISEDFSIDIPLEDDLDQDVASQDAALQDAALQDAALQDAALQDAALQDAASFDDYVEQDVTADFNPPEEQHEEPIVFDDDQDDIVTDEHDIPEVLSDDIFGTGEDQPIEVTHVNKIEDDISYLDGDESIEPDLDDVAIEEPEIETLDFNDDNLEEPELTEFNIDLSGMEQEAENSDGQSKDSVVESMDMPVASESLMDVETGVAALPVELKDEIKSVLSYMDQLLESLPEEKIEEFARSEHFDVYKKLFEELGIS